jgi:hypothetical protein
MRRAFLFAVMALVCGGCVTAPLERYTLNQSLSTTEMRYQEVMNALAVVAANQGTLPSYSLDTGGVANVSQSVSMQATTTWARAAHNFSQQLFNVLGKHSPDLSWTLDPVAEPVLLTGAWYACRWAIYGPPPVGTEDYQKQYDLLRKPEITDIVGCHPEDPNGITRTYHLGVLDDQHPIPSGWLGVGPHHCVPHGACYKAHCGDTYVWIMPEGLQQLSEFTLVLLDIATTDPTWLAQQKQQATVSVDLALPGAADAKSTITETWSACQMEQGGVTQIVVTPFAEPAPEGTNVPNRFVISHVIEKSTLALYQPDLKTPLPLRTGTPSLSPAPNAAPTVHTR